MNIFQKIALLFDREALAHLEGHRNARRADTAKPIELAFTATHPEKGPVAFYQLADPLDRSPRRNAVFARKLEEQAMGMDADTLDLFVHLMETELSGEKGVINVGNVSSLVKEVKARMLLAPAEDQMYVLASVEFFPLGEDLTDYVFDEQKRKIEFWRECMPAAEFFFLPPVSERLRWGWHSKEQLEGHLRRSEIAIEAQNRILQSLSSKGE